MASELTFEEITSECKRDGKLYEDPDFEATDDNLYYSKRAPAIFKWKRPTEIRENPVFILDEATRFDVQQGMLGDSWLLSPISTATMYPIVFHRVVPRDLYFDSKDYCGAVKFNFWFQGKWKEVVVDDRLPTSDGKLVFVHSENPDVFWSALFEKAYAKLHGSYEALKGGQTSEAIVDITGDVVEKVNLKKVTNNKELFRRIQRNVMRSRLIGCSIQATSEDEISAKFDNGLMKGLAYALTAARKVNVAGTIEELVRVRNPWGNEREWNGDYGDKSEYWKETSKAEKRKIGLVLKDDGEFWMSFKDFLENFTTLEIPIETGHNLKIYHGSWIKEKSAGGSRNCPDTFHTNPQFRFELKEEQNVTFALMQKDRRKNKQKGQVNLTIGFIIYKISLENPECVKPRLSKDYLLSNESHCRSSSFVNAREVVDTFELEKGTYVVIPSTFEFNKEGSFLLRVFTEEPIDEGVDEHGARPYVPVVSQPTKIRKPPTPEQKKEFDEVFYKLFQKLMGEDEKIDAFELQTILSASCKKELLNKDISLECCRSLISLIDTNYTNALEYKEFKKVWEKFKDLQTKFKATDADKNILFDKFEMRKLLKDQGFHISQQTLEMVYTKHESKSHKLKFDDVVIIIVTLERLVDNFYKQRKRTNPRKTEVEFTLNEFINAAVGLQ